MRRRPGGTIAILQHLQLCNRFQLREVTMSHIDPADWRLPKVVSVDLTDLHDVVLSQMGVEDRDSRDEDAA